MKTLRYLTMAVATLLLTACMDGEKSLFSYQYNEWDEPTIVNPPYGNNNIDMTNIVTIAELKAHPTYKDAIANSTDKLVTDDLKLRVRVTGNDIGGVPSSWLSTKAVCAVTLLKARKSLSTSKVFM